MAVKTVDQLLYHGLIGIAVVRQLQTDQCIAYRAVADMYGLAVDIRASIFPGIEALVGTNLIDHTKQDLPATCQSDGYGIGRKAMNEVCRTVEGVHHPEHLFVAMRGKSLFGDEARFRQQGFQCLDYHTFRPLVDIRHIVVGMFAFDLIHVKTRTFFLNICPSLTGYTAHFICQFF